MSGGITWGGMGASVLTSLISGVGGFFSAQAQGRAADAKKEMLRARKVTQEAANRQALEEMGRRISAASAAYSQGRGSNVAQLGAGNVEMSSGSAARALEGNAAVYASDAAQLRYAERLQAWQGDSALRRLDAGIEALDAARPDPIVSAIGAFGNAFVSSYGEEIMSELFKGGGTVATSDPKKADYDAMAKSYGRMSGAQWEALFKSYGI